MCQGFSHFSGFLHHFVLAKLATSSIRVKMLLTLAYNPVYDYNPSNAKSTFVKSARMQRFLKHHLNSVMLVYSSETALTVSTLR